MSNLYPWQQEVLKRIQESNEPVIINYRRPGKSQLWKMTMNGVNYKQFLVRNSHGQLTVSVVRV